MVRLNSVCLLVVLASGCGGDKNTAPVAVAASYSVAEDSELVGTLAASDADGDAVLFRLSTAPANGHLNVQERTGVFTYLAAADYHGDDGFTFVAVDSKGAVSTPAQVSIRIAPVNDAPRIALIADAENSPETFEVSIPFSALDVDGDILTYAVEVADASIAEAIIADGVAAIKLRPRQPGQTAVSLRATDGELWSSESFSFRVRAVTKHRHFLGRGPLMDAIEIVNDGPADVFFVLRHNDASLATSVSELVDEALAVESPEQRTMEQRVWAYVNDRTYHWPSLTGNTWLHDPLVLLNSVGFGLCDDVSSALALLAQGAGLQAKVWALEGHVVSELGRGNMFGVYDPDLSVFYRDDNGTVADVAALSADTTLITAPRDPVLADVPEAAAYSAAIAAIYGSTLDNRVHDWYLENAPPVSGMLRLPPGASLQYPGVWTGPPRTIDGTEAYAPVYANMRVILPAGWTGVIEMPLVLKAMYGVGMVQVGTGEYEVSSSALQVSLSVSPNWISSIEILRSDTDLELVYLLNPLRFGATENVELALTGVDVWALRISMIELPDENMRSMQPIELVRKPFH